jgi:hypothetical protein
MIITIGQLKLIHYYYFAMAIFGVVNAFFVGFDSLFSQVFLVFYILNSGVSWYIANVARKKMKDYVVIQSLRFFLNHVIITVLTVGVTLVIWISGVLTDVNLLKTLMTANYFALFLAGLWYAFSRTDFAKELFTVYDSYLFKKCKEFIIKIKDRYRNFFGGEIVSDEDIKRYKYGTNTEVDTNLVSAYQNRSKIQYVLECLGRIELSLARSAIDYLKERIGVLKISNDPANERLIQRAEKMLIQKERNIVDYEKAFYSKTAEVIPGS